MSERDTAAMRQRRDYNPEHDRPRRSDKMTLAWSALAPWAKGVVTVISCLFAALIALGFAFRTPHDEITAVSRRVDTLTAAFTRHVEVHERNEAYQRQLLEGLVRSSCVRAARTDNQLAGLPCDRLLNPQSP